MLKFKLNENKKSWQPTELKQVNLDNYFDKQLY